MVYGHGRLRGATVLLFALLGVVPVVLSLGGAEAGAAGRHDEMSTSPWVIGYYPWYEASEVTPASFPYSKVTHVDIGNVHVTAAGCCTPPAGAAAAWASYAPATVRLAHAAGRKVLLQLGGSDNTPEGWKAGTVTPAATTTLAHSIVSYAQALHVDGVTIDWEQDVNERAVGALAHAVRTSWPKAIITFDIDPYDHDLSWVPSVAPYVDRVDAMTYVSVGNWGGWQGPWHQGALYGDTALNPFSVNRKVRALIAAGLSPRQVGIGIGLFGTGYGDSNGDGRCPTSPTGGWAGEKGPMISDFDLQLGTVARLYAPYMKRTFDPVTRTPYLSAPPPGAGGAPSGSPPKLCYITYEDPQSATEKGRYVRANGLGAVILWAVPQDRRSNGTFPVISALDAALR